MDATRDGGDADLTRLFLFFFLVVVVVVDDEPTTDDRRREDDKAEEGLAMENDDPDLSRHRPRQRRWARGSVLGWWTNNDR